MKPGVTLPTGDEHRGLGNGKASFGATLIASHELGPVTLHANAAYTRNEYKLAVDRELNRHDIWHASVAGGYRVARNLQLVANYGMEINGVHGDDTWPALPTGSEERKALSTTVLTLTGR